MVDRFTYFGTWCSGALIEALKHCPSSSWIKFSSIGYSNIFSAMLAGISCGYAFNLITSSAISANFFGVIFALMIFNINRMITSTFYQSVKYVKGDYFVFSMLKSIPRILLGIVAAVIISLPLQLRIFDVEIQDEISVAKRTKTEHSSVVEGTVNKPGLLEILVAFDNIKKKNNEVAKASNMILLLFILVEIAPVLASLFLSDSYYLHEYKKFENQSDNPTITASIIDTEGKEFSALNSRTGKQ